ncbi:G-protein coupled receptor family C group 6 member A-like [Paramisgurnus dabryanus]|uniref:G-protein coupled receptor family C group 6 member A-like n=1 Tax=Paramisgurnus dabryanus TaxID=90735 RepID=UPI0031F34AD5
MMSYLVLMNLFLMVSWLKEVTEATLTKPSFPESTAPGDIIIGGLFPIHEVVEDINMNVYSISPPQRSNCSRLYARGLTQPLVMIHAVEVANRSPMLRNLNITLGYRIQDTCSDVTTALWAVQDFTRSSSACDVATNSSLDAKPTMAIIGTSSSEISIAVARELNLLLIPQISYASTAIILSDKSRFPAFMRTVPSDEYQTRAMVKLLKDRKWNWVGIITTDGDYGRSAMESFVAQAAQEGICVAFKQILPDSLADKQKLNTSINKTVNTIVNNPKVKVVVSFAKSSQMKDLFKGLYGKVFDRRVWVASDNWSTATNILEEVNLTDIGDVLGFTFKSGNVTSFKQFLKDLQFEDEEIMHSLLKEFLKDPNVGNITVAVQKLLENTNPEIVFSIQLAVTVVAKAVAELCGKRQCKNATDIYPWQFLEQMKNITIEMEGVNYKFSTSGEINLGYDVLLWQKNELKTVKIAEYDIITASFTYIHQNLSAFENVISKCSNSCQPGEIKKTAEGQHTCCYECISCSENYYSNNTDMVQCYSCKTDEWSDPRSSKCNPKTYEYFEWNSGLAIVLLTLAALGVLFLFLISAIFIYQRNSPVVKAAGGPLCHLILVSLLGSFVSVVFFVGEPCNMTCKVRQVVFGLSFTLCVSCILVKSLKILLAFQMNLELREHPTSLYKPYVIICVCTGVQVIICTVWLTLHSPYKDKVPNPKVILIKCNEGSDVAFGVMLAYIILLALVCFSFAYKGRKLPQKYNEAKFITFGMLIYLMACVIFIPVHVTTSGKYLPAVEMVVILISNYGILSCHFLPKCYIIIFKKEHNTRDAFLKNVYEYSCRSAENIRGLSETKPVYIISNSQLVAADNEPHVSAQKEKQTVT